MGDDEKFMRLALKLAAKGNPSPNPYVGAVIVKDGKVIGKGYHKKAGMAHAEVEALKSLENLEDAKGATLYVTLEPCNHFGKTPPCTKAIIEAGISKVVYGMKDPNPEVKGDGADELRKAGLEVVGGVLEDEAAKQNEIFFKYCKTGLPFVLVKVAMSMDGKIATRIGDSKWISGEKARRYGHRLRSSCDAVLVGINTVLKDDPLLTARISGGRNPVKIVLDGGLRIPLETKLLKEGKTLIATCANANVEKKGELEKKGATIILCGQERVDLKVLLAELGKIGITSVLVEGGSEVQGSFLDEGLLDKAVLIYAPILMGGREAKTAFGGKGAEIVEQALKMRIEKVRKLGNDFVFECYPIR
ncbi:MAG: bifunctional diaminohydroxyphosphoribosylaminopyrimidine deaminase/5-amino-6-(5-phosphoribosylamino)uracil reductase RibD [Candidatus ainarchaeum sp.]|nr:bifunctional diaminohydroxyphosphoribosylaminopyrimidine deaminase/5-amino-6-(5-phosphoribosylamino)uracil reductase RibD [Candidatus ainarchaeum sp.]